ncbi:MAG: hypothetical protein JOZ90_16745 [Alphaproteobacteria bacterium]|nr:hypothetical protein [Alphaproteobacteria bacterium]MBV9371539.1 hypothetical protein [Alphaproteobacteria bacterium]MBV9902719.1 hypothetical protein [Alphaproteobacteria bacterium]
MPHRAALVSEQAPGKGSIILLLIVATVLASGALVASVFKLVPLAEPNLLLASGGAIAFGIVLTAFGLHARILEAQEIRDFERRLSESDGNLVEALSVAERLSKRFGDRLEDPDSGASGTEPDHKDRPDRSSSEKDL